MEGNEIQYDELAVRHLAAFNAFTTIYEAKTPRPEPTQVSRDRVSQIIIFAISLVMIAAVIVSGSRTVAEFGGDEGGWKALIGLTAFVMIEGGIMAYAFFRARRTASKTRLDNTLRWATAGLLFTVVVGLGASIDTTMRNRGFPLPDWVKGALDLLVAVSAPALGFISSDVLAIELMALDIKRRDAQKTDDANMKKWQRGLNAEWKAQQKNWGVRIRVETPQPPALPDSSAVNAGNLRKFTSIDRPSPKLKLALEWLREHPEHLETESRKLGELIGVSHATANKAQHIIKAEIDV